MLLFLTAANLQIKNTNKQTKDKHVLNKKTYLIKYALFWYSNYVIYLADLLAQNTFHLLGNYILYVLFSLMITPFLFNGIKVNSRTLFFPLSVMFNQMFHNLPKVKYKNSVYFSVNN